MIERIRVSLWDIFTFFMTGLLATIAACSLIIAYNLISPDDLVSYISKLPAAITIVTAPVILTLLGILIEPPSNYLDKYILNHILGWASAKKQKHSEEENILKKEICEKYLGSLNGKIENPYSICKEYVETKQLSTTFMVFLSRYGFYRNCSFISVTTSILAMTLSKSFCSAIASILIGYIIAGIFKRRAEDFYSYLAPSIYRAFLIDKLNWTSKNESQK